MAKQAEFLVCDEFEVLCGGAAGGGKSDALLIDAGALAHNGPQHPQHRAILFRRSFPELKDLIDRSHELYPAFIEGAVYDKNEHRWRIPWGAMVEFGYLSHDNDSFKYRGRAWNVIGFDELTLARQREWCRRACLLQYVRELHHCREGARASSSHSNLDTQPRYGRPVVRAKGSAWFHSCTLLTWTNCCAAGLTVPIFSGRATYTGRCFRALGGEKDRRYA